MSYSDLVSQFLANGGAIDKCESGARALDDKALRRASGWQPDSLKRIHVIACDECGSEFGETISAESLDHAESLFREKYPESRIETSYRV